MEIPTLDLSDFKSQNNTKKELFVSNLGLAYSEIGFVAIKNHGLEPQLQTDLYNAVKDFFNLPDQIKAKYENPKLKGQRGYVRKMKEHAKGRDIPDLKEFYHIGQDKSVKNLEVQNYPSNIFPEEVPELKKYGLQVYYSLERTGMEILRAIALYLGLNELYFDKFIKSGNSILRPIHYFPIRNTDVFPAGAVRAAEHADINLITLLMGASADGLQVQRMDGQWIPFTAQKNQIIVNVGDMLSRFTNNKLKSTIHRVVNPPKDQLHIPRFSIPFFMHPVSSMKLNCLDSCIDEQHPKLFKDIDAGEYLNQRLKEIGFN